MPHLIDLYHLALPHLDKALGWLVDALPEVSNALLGLLGVMMSFPEKAVAIEQNKRLRRIIANTCMVVGISGFLISVYQRHHAGNQMEQLLGDVKTSVDTLSDVAKKTNTLTENTNSLVTLVSLQLSQLTSLNASMAELNVKIKAAKGNAQVLASLQQEADAARKLATQSTASMLSTLVPQVSQQMQRLTRQYYDSVRKVSDPGHQGGSYFTHEAHVQWMKDRDRANAELRDNYDDAMKLLMPTADLLRQQMLRGLDQTDQDRSEAAEFASAINGNITPNLVVNEANYLDNLLKRLSSQHE